MTLLLDGLMFERNYQPLFADVSCVLQSGKLLQIRGSNGSGKSTLLRILAGFIEPQNGRVSWEGQCIFQQRDDYQQQLHYVGHHNGIKPSLTVYENLTLQSALLHKKLNKQNAHQALQTFKLTHLIDTQAMYLSAGQQRRLSLARLLLHPNRLWILDEPTTALDAEGQDLLTNLLAQHLQQDGIAVIATHHDLQLTAETTLIQLGDGYAK